MHCHKGGATCPMLWDSMQEVNVPIRCVPSNMLFNVHAKADRSEPNDIAHRHFLEAVQSALLERVLLNFLWNRLRAIKSEVDSTQHNLDGAQILISEYAAKFVQ
mmetsp:Transcript_5039/g.9214  ORF Transcript_5039/g.9214 Transcript_5039/m.9214 type:complete len:104 (-) Transcript_5039:7-318(-)